MKQYPVMTADGHLADNKVWNIPAPGIDEVPGKLKTFGMWQIPISYRALAIDMHGRVFGIRSMSSCRESGITLEGRITISGKKYRGFTSDKLFKRNDNSLCQVATIYVCGTPDLKYLDPLAFYHNCIADGFNADFATGRTMEYLRELVSRYFCETGGLYYQLKEYAAALEQIYQPSYLNMREYYQEKADGHRKELVVPTGWS